MKKPQKLIIISLSMFVVTALGITLWYINDHMLLKFDAKSILAWYCLRVGLPAGIITTFIFLLAVFCLKQNKEPFFNNTGNEFNIYCICSDILLVYPAYDIL
jgi:uncharacterized protein with PQ loop repeat